jgi:hypothetical protein
VGSFGIFEKHSHGGQVELREIDVFLCAGVEESCTDATLVELGIGCCAEFYGEEQYDNTFNIHCSKICFLDFF